ncbi:glucosaminidase domain-containing protein [Colwellia sp. BRX10-3]|uniref:glucosaminidase domain-containing protein n=1 Tax=Colwellia sp. BRX10-3 TaxID=2759844 RepID=UPI0015F39764|nr:glucosaminidase domain-containing protein [Colwellia sp. BRX10-3]MBA6390590.1 glucosaminidase domain-containing protein [Colwellia sp. BRX10-3]
MKFNKQFFLGLIFFTLFGVGLIAPFTFLPLPESTQTEQIIEQKTTKSPKKVIKKVEQPLHDVNLPNFAKIRDVKEKKRKFFAFIKPAVMAENKKILAKRVEVERLIEQLTLEQPFSVEDEALVAKLITQYKVSKKFSLLKQLYELQLKVDVIPQALVLVQAANESAWGTSRFARIGLNFFGVWCYSEGCGMVPNSRNSGAAHEVAAYSSVKQGVERYLHNINTHRAYNVFRLIRGQLREQNQHLAPEILATGLTAYSERGADYVLELTEMIRHNRPYFNLTNK